MKTKRLSVKVDWTELYALLIAHFRQLNKLPVGPLDRLQTREFHTLVEKVQELSTKFDLTDRELLSAYTASKRSGYFDRCSSFCTCRSYERM